MSVSLSLIPVALALRIIMKKNHFNEWVESMQVKVPTSFTTVKELERTIRKAGYTFEKRGGVYQTFVNGNPFHFFWEQVDGRWTASFAKSESKRDIMKFIQDINKTADREVVGHSEIQELEANLSSKSSKSTIFPTNFRDGELLFRTLKEFGANPVRKKDNEIECTLDNVTLIFRPVEDGPYQVEIKNDPELRQIRKIFEHLSDLDDEYKRCLQSMVYEKLKERAAAKNMTIENEEVLEDNSIVLTLNIRR